MILYTKEPYAAIFPQQAQADSMPQAVCVRIDGVLAEGFAQADGFHIARLYSTNPRHYLNSAYAPGSVVKHIDC